MFITFIVILVTLVFQGFTLPWLIRKVKLEDRFSLATEEEQEIILQKKIAKVSLQYLKDKHGDDQEQNKYLNNLLARLQLDLDLFKSDIKELIEKNFILVSLYVDDRKRLPKSEQFIHTAADGSEKTIQTIGDLYSTMQSENFKNASQPLYVILNGDEKLMNLPVGYTPNELTYANWLSSGIDAYKKTSGQASK